MKRGRASFVAEMLSEKRGRSSQLERSRCRCDMQAAKCDSGKVKAARLDPTYKQSRDTSQSSDIQTVRSGPLLASKAQ